MPTSAQNIAGRSRSGRDRLLNGSGLFLALVVYFNVRSDGPSDWVDWLVMGAGAALFLFALTRRFRSASD